MADFETKLRWLSERGDPVGAEEMIERIEAELAGDPLVVVKRRREGTTMTKTRQSPTTHQPRRHRGPAWALAAFAVILAVGGLYFAFSGDDGQVANQTTLPTPTTVPTTGPNPTQLTQEVYKPLTPGTYFIDADGEPPTPRGATVIIDSHGWSGGNTGVYIEGRDGDFRLYPFKDPFTPVCGTSYKTPGVSWVAGFTAADLADGFAASGFTVLDAPAPVSAFGHAGHHVVVQVPEGCRFGGEGTPHIWLYPGDVMEVWAFDMNGSVVMVEALWSAYEEAPNEDPRLIEAATEARSVIETLVLTP